MKIAVVGDLIVDEYYDVEVNRISPEYPIPVYSTNTIQPTRVFRGGAAGVAQQLAAFGQDVHLYTRCKWEDVAMLSEAGVNTTYTEHAAPTKRRYYSNQTPLTRIDIEDNTPQSVESEKRLLDAFAENLYDTVVFSDYHKGFFGNTADWILKAGKAYTIVDSKKNPEAWQGCCCFKPNSHSALEMTGEVDIEQAALKLLKGYAFDSVVVTDGDYGVAYAYANYKSQLFKNKSKIPNAFVIGAGDSFAAGLAMWSANRITASMKLSAKFVELGRVVKPIDLLDKVVSYSDLHHFSNRDFKLSFANGCFDVLHPGHLRLLQEAKKHGDKLLVAVNSDESIRGLKGENRPVIPQETRVELLAALPYVDYVCVFGDPTPLNVIRRVVPDVVVKGDDHAPNEVVGADIAEVAIVPRDEWSTTGIIGKSAGSRFFAKLLGRS